MQKDAVLLPGGFRGQVATQMGDMSLWELRRGCGSLRRRSWALQPPPLPPRFSPAPRDPRELLGGRLSWEAIKEALLKGWEPLPSPLASYFHPHHSLAPAEDPWGTGGCVLSVNLWNRMDEHFDLALTRVSTTLICGGEPELPLLPLNVCVFGRARGKQQQYLKTWPIIVRL